jgi:CDP-glycerol glycerophosphotransferase (TagB/SpsB family)
VPADGRLLVLAAKRSELGSTLEALVEAVRERPSVRLVIKTHPAETPDVYRDAVAGTPNVAVAPAHSDLARLLAAADGLVTRNSTVAIDALAVDRPALVVGLPGNLSPFVEAGVMLGAEDGAAIGGRLETLLYDQAARRTLLAAAREFRQQHDMRADGRAADRAADAILEVS